MDLSPRGFQRYYPYMESAFDKVTISPTPGWVTIRPYAGDYKPAEHGHLTVLLSDDQHRAETGERYRRVVQRLETSRAVHEISQFRLDFDPNTQSILIHSILVVRGNQSVEQP